MENFATEFMTKLDGKLTPEKMLGHEKLDTTMIYAKVAQESVRYSHHKYVS